MTIKEPILHVCDCEIFKTRENRRSPNQCINALRQRRKVNVTSAEWSCLSGRDMWNLGHKSILSLGCGELVTEAGTLQVHVLLPTCSRSLDIQKCSGNEDIQCK